MDDTTRRSLLMPFIDQSCSYAYGYEMGLLDAKIGQGDCGPHVIREENAEQARMVARMHGLAGASIETGIDGWLSFTASRRPALALVNRQAEEAP